MRTAARLLTLLVAACWLRPAGSFRLPAEAEPAPSASPATDLPKFEALLSGKPSADEKAGGNGGCGAKTGPDRQPSECNECTASCHNSCDAGCNSQLPASSCDEQAPTCEVQNTLSCDAQALKCTATEGCDERALECEKGMTQSCDTQADGGGPAVFSCDEPRCWEAEGAPTLSCDETKCWPSTESDFRQPRTVQA